MKKVKIMKQKNFVENRDAACLKNSVSFGAA
jgi:hypothetical protein